MIPASHETSDFYAGFFALTRAIDEAPFLVHIDDIDHVAFEVDGRAPAATFVTHQVGETPVTDIVLEPVTEVVRLMRSAKATIDEFPDNEDDF